MYDSPLQSIQYQSMRKVSLVARHWAVASPMTSEMLFDVDSVSLSRNFSITAAQ
jgi:Holliday junction resolvase-like predicted endonuclease